MGWVNNTKSLSSLRMLCPVMRMTKILMIPTELWTLTWISECGVELRCRLS